MTINNLEFILKILGTELFSVKFSFQFNSSPRLWFTMSMIFLIIVFIGLWLLGIDVKHLKG